MKTILSFLLLASLSFAQYTAGKASTPPAGVDTAAVQKEGVAISNSKGEVMQVWFVNQLPQAAPTQESSVTLTTIPHGAFLGYLVATSGFQDRRGNPVKPGVYTMRMSYFPVNGAHQGIAPQRDFVVLSDAGKDKDLKTTPDFAALMKQGMSTTGAAHPLVMSLWKEDLAFKGGLHRDEVHEADWFYQIKIGDTPITFVVAGQAEQ